MMCKLFQHIVQNFKYFFNYESIQILQLKEVILTHQKKNDLDQVFVYKTNMKSMIFQFLFKLSIKS